MKEKILKFLAIMFLSLATGVVVYFSEINSDGTPFKLGMIAFIGTLFTILVSGPISVLIKKVFIIMNNQDELNEGILHELDSIHTSFKSHIVLVDGDDKRNVSIDDDGEIVVEKSKNFTINQISDNYDSIMEKSVKLKNVSLKLKYQSKKLFLVKSISEPNETDISDSDLRNMNSSETDYKDKFAIEKYKSVFLNTPTFKINEFQSLVKDYGILIDDFIDTYFIYLKKYEEGKYYDVIKKSFLDKLEELENQKNKITELRDNYILRKRNKLFNFIRLSIISI